MKRQADSVGGIARCFSRVLFLVALFYLPASGVFAGTCPVVHHAPPTEADKTLLAADFSKAESLYRAGLAASPNDAELIVGLVHALLRDQKVQDAADAVKSALAVTPTLSKPALITLRGEVEFREGEPWIALQSAGESFNIDPCYPRIHLLLADLSRINSFYASARHEVETAHQLDPEDPEIRGEWMMTLPIKQRIAEIEAYLASPSGDDAEGLRHLHEYLDRIKKTALESPKACHLVSQTKAAQIPFGYLMSGAHIEGFGLDVKLNNHGSRLEIDTGAGGILVNSSVAKRAGLKDFSGNEVGGIGDKGEKSGYSVYADSIRIGDMEFKDCIVEVVESHNLPGDVDGLIGMDVFSNFLVTLDYPGRKLLLAELPARPGQEASAGPNLNLEDEDEDSDGSSAEQPVTAQSASSDSHEKASPPKAHGPYDRYIAPEMQDYTKVYRVGHNLMLPTAINASKIKLFIMDTGSWTTIISQQAAREVTKVHGGAPIEVTGLNGKVEKVYSADDITFRFANLSQKGQDVVALDTSKISKNTEMEISGFLGATTLGQLTIHIDYRDGLVKFDYDPKRIPHF